MNKIYWAQRLLVDDHNLPQFNRKLVVTGFNFPDLNGRELIEITVKEILIHKETGIIFKEERKDNINVTGDEAVDLKKVVLSGKKSLSSILKEVLNRS